MLSPRPWEALGAALELWPLRGEPRLLPLAVLLLALALATAALVVPPATDAELPQALSAARHTVATSVR